MMHRDNAVSAKPAVSFEQVMTEFQNLDPSERRQLILDLMATDLAMLAPQANANPHDILKMMANLVNWRNKEEFLRQLGERSEIINRYCLSSNAPGEVTIGQHIENVENFIRNISYLNNPQILSGRAHTIDSDLLERLDLPRNRAPFAMNFRSQYIRLKDDNFDQVLKAVEANDSLPSLQDVVLGLASYYTLHQMFSNLIGHSEKYGSSEHYRIFDYPFDVIATSSGEFVYFECNDLGRQIKSIDVASSRSKVSGSGFLLVPSISNL